jgi:hypothetical protein
MKYLFKNTEHPACLSTSWIDPLTCSESDLTSGSMNPFRHFGRTPWTGDRPIAKPLPTQERTTQKKRRHSPMFWVGFEPKVPMFRRFNTTNEWRVCNSEPVKKEGEQWLVRLSRVWNALGMNFNFHNFRSLQVNTNISSNRSEWSAVSLPFVILRFKTFALDTSLLCKPLFN